MRVLRWLVLLAGLLPALPAHAALSESDGMIIISSREVGWAVHFPSQGYKLSHERHRQDKKGHYYMFANASTGLHVSFNLVPAKQCASTPACQEKTPASMRLATTAGRSRREGIRIRGDSP